MTAINESIGIFKPGSIPELNLSPPERGVVTWDVPMPQFLPDDEKQLRAENGATEASSAIDAKDPNAALAGKTMSAEDEAILRAKQTIFSYSQTGEQLDSLLDNRITELMRSRNLGRATKRTTAEKTRELTDGLVAATGRVAVQEEVVKVAKKAADTTQKAHISTSAVPLGYVEQVIEDFSGIAHNLKHGGADTTENTIERFNKTLETLLALRDGAFTRPDGTEYPFLTMVTDTALAFDANTITQNALRFQRKKLATEEESVADKTAELDAHTAEVEQRIQKLLDTLNDEQYFEAVRLEDKTLWSRFVTAWQTHRRYKKRQPELVESCRVELIDESAAITQANPQELTQ